LTTDYSAFSTRAPLPRIVAEGVRRCEDREAVLEPYFARAAYDVQQECERQMVRMACYAYEQTGARYLCVAGGVGLNGLSNARILQETPFEDVWITPGCSDTGLPLGLALWGYFQDVRQADSPRVSVSMSTAYTGRPYPKNEAIALLERHGIAHETAEPERVAHLIAAGKVVGWVEGGSEFGPRALGHRSILADPRDPGMKDTLNKRVKFREPYRPYAPSLLEEHAAEWLHLDRPSPFMLLVVEVREEKRALVPAITHVDNTTRPQTVTEATNPNYYRMLKEFHRLTGVPMVLNTSLNVNREPIVETPIDALICVFSTAIDFLYIEGELVDCAPYARPELVQQLTAYRTRTLDEEWKTVTNRYLTRYDPAERDAYLAEENRLAEWHRDYRAKYELEKKVLEWNAQRTRIAIVGTRGHTRCLYEYIDGFASLDVAGFIPLDERPGERGDFSRVYREATTPSDLAGVDAILVSTHEYQGIADDLRRIVPASVEVFTMYDDAGDSLLYVLPGRWPVLNELSGLSRPSVSVTRSVGEQEPGTEADPTPPGLADRYALIVRYEFCRPHGLAIEGTNVVDPEALDRQLKALTQNFVCTTLGTLMDPRARLPEVVAVLTFDYGLRDIVANALPALQRWKVPATLFCPAPPLMQRKLLDVHRLLLGRVDDERAAVADLYLSPDEVRRCQDAGLEVAIQGHQYMVHSIRTQDEQRRELQRAIDFFTTTFGVSDLHWAHPYGPDGMCYITPRLTLQDVGFHSGVTRMKAIVKPSDVAARWELPRFDVRDVFDASDHLRPDKLNALFVAD
jgi:peptidoglycan/xylan/chitin deacetylase (PgdA/CDA1 family)